MKKMTSGVAGASAKKRFVQLASGVAMLTSVCAAQARASVTVYDFTVTDQAGDTWAGDFTVTSGLVSSVSGDFTPNAGSATALSFVAVDPRNLLVGNDNVLLATTPYVDGNGIGFATATDTYAWYAPGDGNSYVYDNNASSNLQVSSASVSVQTGVPEASTWLMLLAGFAGLGFVGHRRSSGKAVVDVQA